MDAGQHFVRHCWLRYQKHLQHFQGVHDIIVRHLRCLLLLLPRPLVTLPDFICLQTAAGGIRLLPLFFLLSVPATRFSSPVLEVTPVAVREREGDQGQLGAIRGD